MAFYTIKYFWHATNIVCQNFFCIFAMVNSFDNMEMNMVLNAVASAIKAVKVLYVRPDEENNIGEQLSELEYPLELDEKIYKYAYVDVSCYVEANAEENYDPGDYVTAPYYEIIDKPDVSDIVITVYKLRKDGVEEKTKYKGNEEIKKLLEYKIEIDYPEDYFEKLYDTV